MDETKQHDLADTVGTERGRLELLEEIVAKAGDVDAGASDDDVDLWWGSVEIDRLASGLTLATISKLSNSDSEDDPAGPWLRKSDETGDASTQLTAQGRAAIRRISAAQRKA